MQNIKLSFKGYWREERREFIPHLTGVYLVYRCVHDPIGNTVSLRDLIYIGQSTDVNVRIDQHCNEQDFNSVLRGEETLCFSVAEVSSGDLDLVENALIYAQQPNLNTQGKGSYNYQEASFLIEGRCSLLRYTIFTISSSR